MTKIIKNPTQDFNALRDPMTKPPYCLTAYNGSERPSLTSSTPQKTQKKTPPAEMPQKKKRRWRQPTHRESPATGVGPLTRLWETTLHGPVLELSILSGLSVGSNVGLQEVCIWVLLCFELQCSMIYQLERALKGEVFKRWSLNVLALLVFLLFGDFEGTQTMALPKVQLGVAELHVVGILLQVEVQPIEGPYRFSTFKTNKSGTFRKLNWSGIHEHCRNLT